MITDNMCDKSYIWEFTLAASKRGAKRFKQPAMCFKVCDNLPELAESKVRGLHRGAALAPADANADVRRLCMIAIVKRIHNNSAI